MNIRTLQSGDLDELATLAQRRCQYDQLPRSYLHERIWGDPDTDDTLLLGMWDNGRLVAFTTGVVRATTNGPVGYIKLFATHPEMSGKGLGAELLRRLEAGLAAKGARQIWAGGSAPWYIFPGVDVRYTPALLMLQKAGYKQTGDAVNMQVDLRAMSEIPPELLDRPKKHGYVLRRMTPDDAGAFASWAKQTWNANWAAEGLMALQQTPVSAFLALQNDAIVGFAAYEGARPGWFGPMGTEAKLRGQGIGGALCLLCLEDMRRKGYTHAEISWAGPHSFYSKLVGAHIHRVFRRMKKELLEPDTGAVTS